MTDLNIALIYGSTREGRFCDTVARWSAAQLLRHQGIRLDIVDPAKIELPMRLERQCSPALTTLKTRIGAADAYVIVTPEYNHGYPAILKHLIDSVYGEWQAKPVGFVSYGGLHGGTHAVEQLRQVFAEVHSVTMRNTVSFTEAWKQFDRDGRLLEPNLAEQSMRMMSAQLRWWAEALRQARRQQPYAEIAT
ncbi:FMN reductase [Oxalicibacterium flavum]|uniref:FMN reductase n=1 Tax=Oxalicibacterium flavum TaxID=179467 RepID=A0A8J2UN35_9BURK|nr:NAD(P)H-dependent oxidoreductase [Oxalicibacterium flavum]GGC02079.1 FMN reductase [Oxalicibacterium flavum]